MSAVTGATFAVDHSGGRRSRRRSTAMLPLTPELRFLLAGAAEAACTAVAARSAAVSCWDREADVLRTLVNVGRLPPGEDPFPADEVYPLDSFPAVAALLRERRPFSNPSDIASSALNEAYGCSTQAGVPIVVADAVWGELWVAGDRGRTAFGARDVEAVAAVASALGHALVPLV